MMIPHRMRRDLPPHPGFPRSEYRIHHGQLARQNYSQGHSLFVVLAFVTEHVDSCHAALQRVRSHRQAVIQ
jgi:hypothetical protein